MTKFYKNINLSAVFAASFAFVQTVNAVPMFEVETADHFIWNSGALAANDTPLQLGSYWEIQLIYLPRRITGDLDVQVRPSTGFPPYAVLTVIPEPGDGSLSILYDFLPFYSLTAEYFDADLGTTSANDDTIANVRVEGRVTAPNNVPDGGATFGMVGFAMLGLFAWARGSARSGRPG